MPEIEINAPDLQKLYKNILLTYNSAEDKSAQQSLFANLREKFSQSQELNQLNELLSELALTGEQIALDKTQDEVQTQLNDFIQVITVCGKERQAKELQAAIRQAEEQGDDKVVKQLIEQFNNLK